MLRLKIITMICQKLTKPLLPKLEIPNPTEDRSDYLSGCFTYKDVRNGLNGLFNSTKEYYDDGTIYYNWNDTKTGKPIYFL